MTDLVEKARRLTRAGEAAAIDWFGQRSWTKRLGPALNRMRELTRRWETRTVWRARRLWSQLPPRSRFYARTTQYRNERAAIFLRATLLLGSVALLVGYGVLVGYELQKSAKDSNPLGVGEFLGSLAFTLTRPAVALPLAAALLVLTAWLFRRMRLAWLVWWGGAVLVADFHDGSHLATLSAAQLTAQFRERMAVLRLQAATPSPGAAPEGTFVDVLGGGGDPSSNAVLGLLLRLLRAAVPAYALEVQGIVRERPEEPKYGVTVQVAQTPSQSTPVIEVWERSWEGAICHAADEATAAILPRTRLCRGTWAAWRGYFMPKGLLSAYENAARMEQERRFDEAQDQYWEALRLDPTNLPVRLRLGQLQEKAGLLVAALTNYQRILAFAYPGGQNLPRGMYRRGARPEWDRTLSVAKYRAIILLSDESLAQQWNMPLKLREDHPRRRDAFLRLGVRPRGGGGDPVNAWRDDRGDLLNPLARAKRRDPSADAVSDATQRLLEIPSRCKSEALRAKQLQVIPHADRAARELLLSLPRWESARWRELLTRRTVALSRMSIKRRLEPSGGAPVLGVRGVNELNRAITRAAWRPGLLSGRCPTWLRRWQWHEHYNAACVYAGYLQRGEGEEGKSQQMLVQHAIRRLERAITVRDSEFVITWRDWVVSEDRALARLREKPAFRAFEAMYFPSRIQARAIRSHPRPRDHDRFAEIRCTRDLLARLARSRQQVWQERASGGAKDAHALKAWCEQEREIWKRVGEVVEDRYDWRRRRNLLTYANELLPDGSGICVSFARYEERLPVDEADMEWLRAEERLDELAGLFRKSRLPGKARRFDQWDAAMCRYDGYRAPSPRRRAQLCDGNAAIWGRLSQWLHAGEEDMLLDQRERLVEYARKDLARELRRTSSLWHRRSSRRRLGALPRALS
ncbi:MAG: hypothetical protein WB709_05875 [Solirubrobacteraceae bacterium]